MNKALSCALAVTACLVLTSADGFAATKKKTKKVAKSEPTRAEIYDYCRRLIAKKQGASTRVHHVRRLSTGKYMCYYID